MQKYFKLFNEQENHNGLQYKDGLNTDTIAFNSNPKCSCIPGGLYFSDAKNILEFLNKDSYYIREVEVPEGELIVKDSAGEDDGLGNKWRAHSLYLHEKHSFGDTKTWGWIEKQGINIDKVHRWLLWGVSPDPRILKSFVLSESSICYRNDILFYAAYNNNKEIVQILIDKGADLNRRVNEKTPLIWAVATVKSGSEVAKLLIDSGVSLNAQDVHGRTALIWAAWMHKKEIVKLLIDSGANPNLKDIYSKTYMDYL